mgnify:FL=1|tara:strand:- start:11807 stop:12847 length:1041 start_codon:yes stop_codon:yes gene_type:complete
MKFLNKKEQVLDFKLTSYGHYLLSAGKFKPVYYGFYDDNVLYDGRYGYITESANSIHNRIKQDTQYLGTQTHFEEVGGASKIIDVGGMSVFAGDIMPIMEYPRKDTFRFDQMIGDAYLEGDTNVAPAWKVVCLQGQISSSAQKDNTNNLNIPQLNVQLNYRKKITKYGRDDSIYATFDTGSLRQSIAKTQNFADDSKIELIRDDLLFYAEELNTVLLKDNFEVEVFEILTGALPARCPTCSKQSLLKRKYFPNDYERVESGLIDETYLDYMQNKSAYTLSKTTSSVFYYFEVQKDDQVNSNLVCRSVEFFNKKSYYIDLDFDCSSREPSTGTWYDIYGVATEPEIC